MISYWNKYIPYCDDLLAHIRKLLIAEEIIANAKRYVTGFSLCTTTHDSGVCSLTSLLIDYAAWSHMKTINLI